MTPIRYLAATDTSPIALVALEYLKGFLRLKIPVRVVSLTGPPAGRWEAYSPLLTTPLEIVEGASGVFVNAVCCDPSRWVWRQRVPMTTVDGDFTGEVAEGMQELWTVGVWNVLLTNKEQLVAATQEQLGATRKYQRIVTTSRCDVGETVVATPVVDLPLLRTVVTPC